MQSTPEKVTAYSDTDHAGWLKTRKSTSCTMIAFGKHLVRCSSTTQGVIALSSGESEFYGGVKSASIGLGIASMLADMGMKMAKPLELKLDATAGLGIASRRGAGRIRHIHTPSPWLQKAVADGRVQVSKIAGDVNPADLGTKYLDRKSIEKIWQQCGFVLLQGHSRMAYRATCT